MSKMWTDFQPHEKLAVRRRIAALVGETKGKELTHEHIEAAIVEVIPALKDATVDDDEFHVLITEVYAEYLNLGAAEF